MSIAMGITMIWLVWNWTKDQTEGEENFTASCEHSILLAKDQPMQPIPEEIPIAYDAEYSAKIAYESVDKLDIRVVAAVETIENIAATVDSIETIAELLQAKAAIEAAASFVEESAKSATAAAETAVGAAETANRAATVVLTVANSAKSAFEWAIKAEDIAENIVAIAENAETIANETVEKIHLLHTMAKVIYAEAQGEPMNGKIAVGATMVNRLHSKWFPNTIDEVVEGQYASTKSVTTEKLDKNGECLEAAKRALNGEDPLAAKLGEPTIYFLNPDTADSDEVVFRLSRKNYAIESHVFSGLSLYWK